MQKVTIRYIRKKLKRFSHKVKITIKFSYGILSFCSMKVCRPITLSRHYERVINFEMLYNYAHYVNYCYVKIFGPEFQRGKLHFKVERFHLKI